MRAILTPILVFFSFLIGFSQVDTNTTTATNQTDISKNELRLNVFSFIAFGSLEVDYEYLLTEESSVGVSVLIGLDNPDDLNLIRNFSIAPYYRQYFSKRYARGFFVEGFAMVLSREDSFFISDFDSFTEEQTTTTDFALGVSAGGKFLTRGGFVAEVFAGIGRTVGGNADFTFNNVIGRGGISLGYRF